MTDWQGEGATITGDADTTFTNGAGMILVGFMLRQVFPEATNIIVRDLGENQAMVALDMSCGGAVAVHIRPKDHMVTAWYETRGGTNKARRTFPDNDAAQFTGWLGLARQEIDKVKGTHA